MNKNTIKIITIGGTVVASTVGVLFASLNHLKNKKKEELITLEANKETETFDKSQDILSDVATISDETIKIMTDIPANVVRKVSSEILENMQAFVTTPTLEINKESLSFTFIGKEHQYDLVFYNNNKYILTVDCTTNTNDSRILEYQDLDDIKGDKILEIVNEYISEHETA